MFKEYIQLYKQYSEKYGNQTAIFLMVGSFYELYDIQENETGETECNILEIIDILGIQLSTKKTGDFSVGQTGLFAGFPDYVLHKWAGRLTSAGWTVVIVDQIKDTRGKVSERRVSRILSPSTHIENISSTDIPYIATLYFIPSESTSGIQFGIAILDLTTGKTITYSGIEKISSGQNDLWTADELTQMLNVYAPKELLVYWHSSNPSNRLPDDIFFRRMFNLSSSTAIHRRVVKTLGGFSSECVRNEYLQKVYTIQSLLSPKTYLGLQTETEELALVYLLQFVEEHFPSLLKSFQRNERWTPQSRLICGNHALTQLQMIGNKTNETVVYLFNKCITPMGKRAIRERLITPFSNAIEIQFRLNQVQEYMSWSEEQTRMLEKQLRFMFDLPRLHRKMLCGTIHPSEIVQLFQTYNAIERIGTIIPSLKEAESYLNPLFTDKQWREYQQVFHAHFSEIKAQQFSEDRTAFNSDMYPDIARIEKDIELVLNGFQLLRQEIAETGGLPLDVIRLEKREKEPFGIRASLGTLQQLKKHLSKLPEGFKCSELKSGGWIDCSRLQQLNTSLQKLRESLVIQVRRYIVEACLAISNIGQSIWKDMENWVSNLDCTQCIGRVSRERGFCCPEILGQNTEESSVDIRQIRHPLVEACSISKVEYVKHDISLGDTSSNWSNSTNSSNYTKGWLVYGMNASGKSTLMKAVGICILLAQAGCFVPAQSMRLVPFHAIYTRILNQDNLFAGLSSFAVEMAELRDILRHANSHTLVLGDELCSGTESISAQALVSSGIQWLCSKSAKFIFATHLHGLTDVLDIDKLKMQVWHLHVEYNPSNGKLIYDRSLRTGKGSSLYGLEVARAMDLPFEFIEQALQNRNRMIGAKRMDETSNSTWNREIFKKECEVCHKNICSELEVHHIVPRSKADSEQRLPDGSHMNDKRNLIVLCQKCHDHIHAGQIEIGRFKMTSEGPKREIQHNPKINREIENKIENKIENNQKTEPVMTTKSKSSSKWSEEDLDIIRETLKTCTNLSLKSIRGYLSSKYCIEINESYLGKIRKTLY